MHKFVAMALPRTRWGAYSSVPRSLHGFKVKKTTGKGKEEAGKGGRKERDGEKTPPEINSCAARFTKKILGKLLRLS